MPVACSTYNVAKVKQVPAGCCKSVVEISTRGGKNLRKLALQVVLGGLCRRQYRRDLEIIHCPERADRRADQDVGRRRLELLAGERVEQDLGRSGDGIERARDLCTGAAPGMSRYVDGNRH